MSPLTIKVFIQKYLKIQNFKERDFFLTSPHLPMALSRMSRFRWRWPNPELFHRDRLAEFRRWRIRRIDTFGKGLQTKTVVGLKPEIPNKKQLPLNPRLTFGNYDQLCCGTKRARNTTQNNWEVPRCSLLSNHLGSINQYNQYRICLCVLTSKSLSWMSAWVYLPSLRKDLHLANEEQKSSLNF